MDSPHGLSKTGQNATPRLHVAFSGQRVSGRLLDWRIVKFGYPLDLSLTTGKFVLAVANKDK